MQRIITLAILGSLGWYGYGEYQARTRAEPDATPAAETATREVPSRTFRCDGRTYCSQMTSCEEATYFLRNCPGTKMDGNNDGVPCEKQWCR